MCRAQVAVVSDAVAVAADVDDLTVFVGSEPMLPSSATRPRVHGLRPHAVRTTVLYRLEFSSTTTAFRLSPANFARFIGDFRNAALNVS